MKNRRVVITGTGIIAPTGVNVEEFWNNCLSGRTNVENIPEEWLNYAKYNSKIWSPLPLLDFDKYGLSRIEQKQLDMTSLLSIAAVFQAIESAGFSYFKTDEKRNLYKM